jgi:hypothetical protein
MKQGYLLIFVGGVFLGCSTLSQPQAFEPVQTMTKVNGIERVQWIHTSQEATKVTEEVESLLTQPLTQNDAVRIALINNRALQKTYESIGISHSELIQAGLMNNPLLGYSLGRGGGLSVATLGIEIPFLDLLWIPLRKKMGGLALEETQYQVGDEVLKAVREVKKSFIDLSMAQAKVKLFDEQRVSYETALQLATRQYTAGNLSKRDKLRIHDMYARARLELMQLHRESAIARENLNRWMGVYGTQTQYTLAPERLSLPEKLSEVAPLESWAIEHRLNLKATLKRVEYAATEGGYVHDRRFISDADVLGQIEKTTAQARMNTVGLRIPIPLFDIGAGKMERASSVYHQRLDDLYDTAIMIRSSVREAYATMHYNYDQAHEIQTVILPLNHQILKETQGFYNGMLESIYDLLGDQRRYVQTQSQWLHALGEFQKSQADLEYVMGGESNETHQ